MISRTNYRTLTDCGDDLSYLIVVQARTNSSRLTGKILKSFYKHLTLLEVQLSRLVEAFGQEKVVIATSDSEHDDQLASWLLQENYRFYRGSENDLVQRFVDTCKEHSGITHIVRVCADNPFLRPEYIVELLKYVADPSLDYVSYQHQSGTPSILGHSGLFAEMIKIDALERVLDSTTSHLKRAVFREHPTLYVLENRDEFQLKFINMDPAIDEGDPIRLTVDTLADFEIAQRLYKTLIQNHGNQFSVHALLQEIRSDSTSCQQMANNILSNKK